MHNRVIVAPAVEPITLAEAKQHLRVSTTDQDTLITALIQAAREYVELYCGRSLITQTREQTDDSFYDAAWHHAQRLYYGPVQSITSIQYVDMNGDLQTVDTSIYTYNLVSDPATFYAAYGKFWPVPRFQKDAVIITYVAGYAGTGSPLDLRGGVPEMIKTAIKMLVGHYYDNARESSTLAAPGLQVVPMGVETLLMPYRMSIL